jgi:uncharacterized protein (DUF1800 family)
MAVKSLPPLDQLDPAVAWEPWQPDGDNPFNRKWAAHLYRRAAFGTSPTELQQAESRGLKATLDLILDGEPRAKNLHNFLQQEGDKISRRNNAFELRAWWVYCMLNSGHPLREKMTLFWHNHFATSIAKVQRPVLMARQNRLLREHALSKFGPFLLEMSKDTAMLIWLDSNNNLAGKPNENYAREVMELFSLGIGNYTEKDIREAARAFTGWHTDGDDFEFNASFHDNGPKTVLGETGNLNGDDVVKIILRQPACARFLVSKLYRYFISELQEPPARLIEPLAEKLRRSDYDVRVVVKAMLSSRLFFSEHAFRQRIKNPVEYVLGAARTVVEGLIPQQYLVAKLEALGQNLFAPPNVKGWPGAQTWVNTSTLLARQNFNQKLAMGTLWNEVIFRDDNPFNRIDEPEEPPLPPGAKRPERPEEPAPLPHIDPARPIRNAKITQPDKVVDHLLDLYLPGGVSPSVRSKMIAFVAQGKPAGTALDRRVRELVHAIMSTPEYQLA